MTGFYGSSSVSGKQEAWNLLRLLHGQYNMPWLCMGDFSEVFYASEKEGGIERNEVRMRDFRNVCAD